MNIDGQNSNTVRTFHPQTIWRVHVSVGHFLSGFQVHLLERRGTSSRGGSGRNSESSGGEQQCKWWQLQRQRQWQQQWWQWQCHVLARENKTIKCRQGKQVMFLITTYAARTIAVHRRTQVPSLSCIQGTDDGARHFHPACSARGPLLLFCIVSRPHLQASQFFCKFYTLSIGSKQKGPAEQVAPRVSSLKICRFLCAFSL